jgi:hypothetical protein
VGEARQCARMVRKLHSPMARSGALDPERDELRRPLRATKRQPSPLLSQLVSILGVQAARACWQPPSAYLQFTEGSAGGSRAEVTGSERGTPNA